MRERPIIMSKEMVKAILDGNKSQTRRVIKPQLKDCTCGYPECPDWTFHRCDWVGYKYEGRDTWYCRRCGNGTVNVDEFSAHGFVCPYGQVGDRLWVRETWMPFSKYQTLPIRYRANFPPEELAQFQMLEPWHPSIFMPKKYARIWLEITGVKVERVQDISPPDILAEGYDPFGIPSGVFWFKDLWGSINAKRGYSWESNCWVWVIEFKTRGMRWQT